MPPLTVSNAPSGRQKRKHSPSSMPRGTTTRHSSQKKKVLSSLSSSDASDDKPDDEPDDEFIDDNSADDESEEGVEKLAEGSENHAELATPKPAAKDLKNAVADASLVQGGTMNRRPFSEVSPNSKELRTQARYAIGME